MAIEDEATAPVVPATGMKSLANLNRCGSLVSGQHLQALTCLRLMSVCSCMDDLQPHKAQHCRPLKVSSLAGSIEKQAYTALLLYKWEKSQ